MLGFPSVIFWALLGGYAYTQKTGTWEDWNFLLAFACLLGMTTFSALAANALKTKKEELGEGDEFIDEGKDDLKFIDEKGSESGGRDGSSGSWEGRDEDYQRRRRVQGVRDRAMKRRSNIRPSKEDFRI